MGLILRTTDGGTSWVPQTSESLQIFYGVSFADANNGIIVGFAGEILTTTDGGSNWVVKSRGTTQTLYGVSFIDVTTGTSVGAARDNSQND